MTTAEVEALRQQRQARAEKFRSTREQRIAGLIERRESWVPVTSKAGRKGYAIPSSEPGKYYLVDLDGCECPDARRHGSPCKHQAALERVLEREGRRAEFAPVPPPLDDKFWDRFLDRKPTSGRLPVTTRED